MRTVKVTYENGQHGSATPSVGMRELYDVRNMVVAEGMLRIKYGVNNWIIMFPVRRIIYVEEKG